MPKDPIKRARARAIAEIVNSGIQPFQNANVCKRLAVNEGEEKKNEWLQFYINKGLRAVEEMLKETSGLYCVGDEVSIADLCLAPQVYSAKRFNIDLTQYPLICAINERLEKLDPFKKAHAHRQPDTLEELREK